MPKPKRDELKAGIFVVVALAITVAVILWLSAGEVFRTSGQKVVFYIPEDVVGAGIDKGSSIEIGGVEVGRIIDLEYRPDLGRSLYTGRLNTKEIAIHADGKAIASNDGIVGGATVAIVSRGSADAALADEDHPLEITGGVGQAISNLSASTASLRDMLDGDNPESARSQVHTILGWLEVTSGNLAAISEHLAAETDAQLAGSLLSKFHSRMDEIGQFTPALIASAERLTGMLTGASEIIARLNAGEGTLGSLLNDPRLYEGMLDSVAEMGMLLEDIRKALSGWKAAGVPLKLK